MEWHRHNDLLLAISLPLRGVLAAQRPPRVIPPEGGGEEVEAPSRTSRSAYTGAHPQSTVPSRSEQAAAGGGGPAPLRPWGPARRRSSRVVPARAGSVDRGSGGRWRAGVRPDRWTSLAGCVPAV